MAEGLKLGASRTNAGAVVPAQFILPPLHSHTGNVGVLQHLLRWRLVATADPADIRAVPGNVPLSALGIRYCAHRRQLRAPTLGTEIGF